MGVLDWDWDWDEQDDDEIYRDIDYEDVYGEDIYGEDEDEVPEGCRACGGPYPLCADGCSLIDN